MFDLIVGPEELQDLHSTEGLGLSYAADCCAADLHSVGDAGDLAPADTRAQCSHREEEKERMYGFSPPFSQNTVETAQYHNGRDRR